MTIRRTIILLTVPLFLLLAMVNGALLYFQEQAEMSHALSEQALSAAVTSAEFISSMERPAEQLAEPLRVKALRRAARHIAGLDGLYLVTPDTRRHALVPAVRPWSPERFARPAAARALPAKASEEGGGEGGQRFVVALAPVTGGGFVAARIDAEPMFAKMAAIREAILLIVLAAGIVAAALAWFVARRIVRELEKNHQAILAIGAGEPFAADQGLSIREARDLASAVRLMEASSHATAERSRRVTARRDRERTVATALTATRAARFAPLADEVAGAKVAARICGDAAPGSFFALASAGDSGNERAMIVIGRCSGDSPQAAFAQAIAARRFLEENLPAMATEECLAAARRDYAIEALQHCSWTAAAEPAAQGVQLLALADPVTTARAQRYADQNRDAAPGELIDGIALLLHPAAVFAAIGR